MINTEYQRIRSSILQIKSLNQVQPLKNWIELFLKAFKDVDDYNDLKFMLVLKEKQLILGYSDTLY